MVVATIQHQQNHRLRTDSSLSHRGAKMHFTGTKSSPYILLLLKYKKCSARMKVSKLLQCIIMEKHSN